MAKIIFFQHPGDLLEFHGGIKVRIHLGNFVLDVKKIKLLPHNYFLIEINIPSNKINREAVMCFLNEMLFNGEINSYSLSS